MALIKSEYRSDLERRLASLSAQLDGLNGEQALRKVLQELFQGRSCVVSSFGAESVVILHMVSSIDPDTPVIFLDTEKLFSETHEYKRTLAHTLRLTNIITLRPSEFDLEADDPDGNLHKTDTNLCCYIRKTLPLVRALRNYDLWITGRKRSHGGERTALPQVELQDGKLKLNPLFDWSAAEIRDFVTKNQLPDHPLLSRGYPSVGCIPCTQPVERASAGPRVGRWAGQDKTECGIHIGADGKISRAGGL